MKEKLKQLFFILALGSISASVLLGTRSHTLPLIERHRETALKSNVLSAAGVEYDEDNLDRVFKEGIKEVKAGRFIYYLSPEKFYIFEFEGRGLWGMIKGLITLRPDLETIESIKIISQEETPGLGGRIEENSFLDQFRKKKVSPKLVLALRQKAARTNEIDSITGASMTSQALTDMINESVANFREIAGGKNNAYR